jgi:putative transposase
MRPFLIAHDMLARHLKRIGHNVGRRRAWRLMATMGLMPTYQRPRTSAPHPQHQIYMYPLRKLAIKRPNHVWCADVTYNPRRRGFLYLLEILDWATGKVLAWRPSNTRDAGFCVAALEEALARFGKPEIFNTERGSQFTSFAFTRVLREAEVRISMDGRERWMDNAFIERLAIPEVRVRLSPCLRNRIRASRWPCPEDHLLQYPASALGSSRTNPGRGLWADRAIR